MADDGNKTLKELATPTAHGPTSSIARPEAQANSFELKPGLITMVQNSQFAGLLHENPNDHIENFLEICYTYKQHNVTTDASDCAYFLFL